MTDLLFLKRVLRAVVGLISRLKCRLALWMVPGLETGSDVRIMPFVRIRVTGRGHCRLGATVVLDRGADLNARDGTIEIGTKSYVGMYSVIVAQDSISIGTGCLIAERVTIRDQDHRVTPGKVTADNGFDTAPIEIGNNVWIGANCTITRGVRIGDNAVIGAGAVVTRDVPSGSVAAGVPAKVFRSH